MARLKPCPPALIRSLRSSRVRALAAGSRSRRAWTCASAAKASASAFRVNRLGAIVVHEEMKPLLLTL